jgi:hypothetical protein
MELSLSHCPWSAALFSSLANWLYVLVLVCLIAAASANLVQPFRENRFFATNEGGQTVVASYVQYYICGRLANSDLKQRSYDPAAQLAMTNDAIKPLSTDKIIFSQYVPYFFSLMVPFALLPLPQSYLAWMAFGTIFGIVGTGMALKGQSRCGWFCLSAAVTGLVASLSGFLTWRFGQLTWLLLGLTSLYFWALLKDKAIVAGVLLALSTLKPQYAVFLAVPPLSGRKWRLIVSAAVMELLLIVVAAASVGWANVISYPGKLIAWDTSQQFLGVFPEKMISLRGVLTNLLPGPVAHIGVIFFLLLFLGATGVIWYVSYSGKRSLAWAAALTTVSMLVASPHSHIYDELLIFAAGAVTLPSLSLPQLLKLESGAFKFWCLILVFYPGLSWLLYVALIPFQFLCFAQVLVTNLVFLALGTACWMRSSSFPQGGG